MKPKTLVIIALVVVFAVGVAYALLREIGREEASLGQSISGVVEVSPQLFAQGVADIVRTDRIALFLVDPKTDEVVAMRTISPLVPPQTIRIGEKDARGKKLEGSYLLIGIVDKDGEIFKTTPGEVYGASSQPVPLGTEDFRLVLDQPYHGNLFNEATPQMAGSPAMPPAGAPSESGPASGQMPGGMPGMGSAAEAPARPLGEGPDAPEFSVQGTIRVTDELRDNVKPTDHLIILLFDPVTPQPVAFKILPHTLLPQKFSITVPPQARATARDAYSLRAFTDKNNNPFGSAPGELAGRSEKLIPLGSKDVTLFLNVPYKR